MNLEKPSSQVLVHITHTILSLFLGGIVAMFLDVDTGGPLSELAIRKLVLMVVLSTLFYFILRKINFKAMFILLSILVVCIILFVILAFIVTSNM